MMLSVDVEENEGDHRATELHEWIHSELLDNSTYGYFQRLIYSLSVQKAVNKVFRERCCQVFSVTMQPSILVQEGLASYRALVWHCAAKGQDAGRKYLEKLPSLYRKGLELVLNVMDDPRARKISFAESAAVHATCVYLGMAALNSPLLSYYRHRENLFKPELPYIESDGPDARLQSIVTAGPRLKLILLGLRIEALELLAKGHPASAELEPQWFALMDHALETIRGTVSDMPIVTHKDRGRQIQELLEDWVPELQKTSEVRRDRGEGGSVTNRRIRSVRFARLNPDVSKHEAHTVPRTALSHPAELIETIRANSSTKRIWILIAALVPRDLTTFNVVASTLKLSDLITAALKHSDFATFQLSVLALPMQTGWPSALSPLSPQPHALACQANLDEFQKHSRELTEMGAFWYANEYHLGLMRQHGIRLEGFTIEKMASTGQLMEVLNTLKDSETLGYGVYVWKGHTVLALLARSHFRFCLATLGQRELFQQAVQKRKLLAAKGVVFQVGPGELPDQAVGRIALWVFIGQ